jgi:sugar lactone lactonase YvrE
VTEESLLLSPKAKYMNVSHAGITRADFSLCAMSLRRAVALASFCALAACGGGGGGGGSHALPSPSAATPTPVPTVTSGTPTSAGLVFSNDPHVSGTQATGYTIVGNQPLTFTAASFTASGAMIVGSAAPTLTVQSGDSAISVQPAPTQANPDAFRLRVTALRTAPVTLTVTASVSGAPPVSTKVSVTTVQELWVGSNGTQSLLGFAIIPGTAPTQVDDISDPAHINFPTGLAFDANGNLWVAERNENTITEYTPPFLQTSTPSVIITNGDPGPTSVAFDAAGNLWAPTFNTIPNGTIVEYTPPFGSSSAPATTITTGLTNNIPTGLAFDANGNAWIAELVAGNTSSAVAEFSQPLTSTSSPSVMIPGASGGDVGLAFDPTGNLWVANQSTTLGSVFELAKPLTSSSTPGATITSGINTPGAPAFDASGNLWVGNLFGNTVTAYNATTQAPIAVDTISSVVGPVGLVFAP